MPMNPTSTTYDVKFTGKSGEKTINKTISGLDADWISDPDNVNILNNKIFGILDSGTATAFSIITTKTYDAVAD